MQQRHLAFRHLPRAGLTPSLAMGFRRESGRIEGHAWIVIDGHPFDEPAIDGAPFEETCRIGVDGRIVTQPQAAAPATARS